MTVRLHANESPYDLMKAFKNELNNALSEFAFNQYPDEHYTDLRMTLSEFVNESSDKIIVTNGSDELIKLLMETYTTESSYVLAPTPSFMAYGFLAKVTGCNFCEIRPDRNLGLNEDEYLKQIKALNPALVFICTPNNPTGEKISNDTIKSILEISNGIVVVDEAYIEFSQGSIIDWTSEYGNLIIMRTLSKAFGLASLRVGYGVACKEIINQLNLNRMPYNVSALSALTADLALRNIDYKKIVMQIKKEKKRVESELLNLPIKLYPSDANFILIESSLTSNIISALESKNIRVRAFNDSPLLKNHFRFSIGEPKDNTQLIDTIREVFSNENI